jgi:hypothetical protein
MMHACGALPLRSWTACRLGSRGAEQRAETDAVSVADVRLHALQRRVVESAQLPLVYFSDLQIGSEGWSALQLLAPYAFDPAEGYEARPNATLSRSVLRCVLNTCTQLIC